MHAIRRFVSLLILGTLALVLLLFIVKGPTGFALITEDQIEYDGVSRPTHVVRIGPVNIRLVADITERTHQSVEEGKTGANSEDRQNDQTGTRKVEDNNEKALAENAFWEASLTVTSGTEFQGQHSPAKTDSDILYDTKPRPQYDVIEETVNPHMENARLDGNTSIDPVSASVRNSSGPARNDDMTCTPRKNLLFLKTHKTGSSTIQNILYRYGDANGLTFALPRSDVYMGVPALFRRTFAIKSPTGKYNMLANHARYNRPEMAKIMYENAAYVTIFRHPSTQFDSMFTYYGFGGFFKVKLSGFADNPLSYYRRQGSTPLHSALNPTLYDLGMETSEFSNKSAILHKIATLEEEFDLVLVAEYLLESLVLLKDLMCWDLSDVTYFSANARTKSKVNEMSERTFTQLYKWNHGDALLYEHFNRTLWMKVKAYGRERMARDVRTLGKMNEALAEKCLGGTQAERSVSTLVSRYVLKDSMKDDVQCIRMIRPAAQYLDKLKKKQTGTNLRHL